MDMIGVPTVFAEAFNMMETPNEEEELAMLEEILKPATPSPEAPVSEEVVKIATSPKRPGSPILEAVVKRPCICIHDEEPDEEQEPLSREWLLTMKPDWLADIVLAKGMALF